MKRVSVTLPGGSVTAVTGPNGSGKSTLLKGLMGFPGIHYSGEATLDGRPVSGMKGREKARLIGYLPQSPPVPSGLTGLETVLLGRYPHRSPWAGDSASDLRLAREALGLVGAEYLAEKYSNSISGGELRLLNLAAVLVQETPVILLDEPASSLDYGHASGLWRILSRLASRGKIILAATHRIGMAGGYLQNVLLLGNGVQRGWGSPDCIIGNGKLLSEVYGTALNVMKNDSGGGWVVCPGVD